MRPLPDTMADGLAVAGGEGSGVAATVGAVVGAVLAVAAAVGAAEGVPPQAERSRPSATRAAAPFFTGAHGDTRITRGGSVRPPPARAGHARGRSFPRLPRPPP